MTRAVYLAKHVVEAAVITKQVALSLLWCRDTKVSCDSMTHFVFVFQITLKLSKNVKNNTSENTNKNVA